MDDFEPTLKALDLGLFRHVVSQSTDNDRRAFLALQLAAREQAGGYVYLEIGSYKGGSLQPHVVDPRCVHIHSIDLRPRAASDVRGAQNYVENSTEVMLGLLRGVPGADLAKLKTYEATTASLPPASITPRPDWCFIDGEHTDEAVLRDSRFCLGVLREPGCLVYHDANIVYNGILRFLDELRQAGRAFDAFHVSDSVFVLEFGGRRFGGFPAVRGLIEQNHQGYLWSLHANDLYREFYYQPAAKTLRSLQWRWNRWFGRPTGKS
jgi:hypothetical protein